MITLTDPTRYEKELTDNQRLFLESIAKLLKLLYSDVECSQSVTEMVTQSHTTSGKRFVNQKKVATVWQVHNTDFKLTFTTYGKSSLELHLIEVFNQGGGMGSSLMALINEVSVTTKTCIFLIPVDFRNTPVERLRNFYHRFNYQRCCKNVYWSNIGLFTK